MGGSEFSLSVCVILRDDVIWGVYFWYIRRASIFGYYNSTITSKCSSIYISATMTVLGLYMSSHEQPIRSNFRRIITHRVLMDMRGMHVHTVQNDTRNNCNPASGSEDGFN